MIGDPIYTEPNESKIQELYNKPSINILQYTKELEEVDIEEIKNKVMTKLPKEKKKNWKFLFSHQNIFDEFEEQVKNDTLIFA